MAANRNLRSILIVSPATILTHWLSELEIWAPGLRRILCHKSGEQQRGLDNTNYQHSRNISRRLLKRLDRWLDECRADRV